MLFRSIEDLEQKELVISGTRHIAYMVFKFEAVRLALTPVSQVHLSASELVHPPSLLYWIGESEPVPSSISE